MKKRFQHTISLVLALLVLVSTQSFSINSHYCGIILVDKAFIKSAKKCAMHNQEIQTYHEEENQKEDCCSNEFELIEKLDHLFLTV